jgi:hypothetical protein
MWHCENSDLAIEFVECPGRGLKVSLTTPEKFEQNDVYTEEGLFLYWRTTSILWQEIVSSNVFQKYLIIPVNWPAHVVGGVLDFGERRKELDLNKLIDVGNKNGKSVILLFPISPNPLQANGGIPSSLAVNNAVNAGGLFSHSLYGDEIVKFYSFFDTRIYRSYSEFIKKVSSSIKMPQDSYRVVTGEFGSVNAGEFNSFFTDHGHSFKKAFEQYLNSIDERDKKIRKMGEMKRDFTSFVKSLYFKEVHRNFSSVFLCHQLLGVINSGESHSLTNLFSTVDNVSVGNQILDAYSNEIIPIAWGVDKSGRNEIFSTQIKQLVNANYLDRCFEGFNEAEDSVDFLPLSLFTFVGASSLESNVFSWKKTGLLNYLNKSYGRCFNHKLSEIERIRDNYLLNKVLFICAKALRSKDFFVLKEIFYSGAQIILDINDLEEDKDIFLKEFLMSREIKKEVVNIGITFSIYSVHNSTLIVFNSREFESIEINKNEIWKKVIASLTVHHFHLDQKSHGVLSCWRSRSAKPNEMNFDEIRRLSFYNMTDYRKDINVKIKEGFYLLKTVDKHSVTLDKEDDRVKMNFSPKSSISLDFGIVYE